MVPFTMKKKYIIAIVLTICCAVCWFGVEYNVLPYIAIRPQRIDIHQMERFKAGGPISSHGSSAIDFDVMSHDGVPIDAVLLRAESPKATIILVHGIGACKEFFIDLALRLTHDQFNVVLFDLRAQGQSGGDYCTYGAKETGDIRCLVDSLVGIQPNTPIGIYGTSLGGALALLALANDQRIQCGIIESTYHRLETVMNKYWTDWTSLNCPNLVRRTMYRSAAIAGFDPTQVDPLSACQRIACPILFAHGDQDEKIPLAFNWQNYEAVQGNKKEFITIHGAGHLNVHAVGGQAYYDKMIRFLNSSLSHPNADTSHTVMPTNE
jgi:uncharacterized protein